MKDKSRKQPTKELTQLRRRIVELEALERKRNQFEEALRTERDKTQQYLDIAGVILVALNKRGEITLINRKGNQILGYKEEELLGKNWFTTCVPPSLRKDVKSVFLKLMEGKGRITEFYKNSVLTKSGTERIIAWHNTVLKDAQGTIIGTLGSGEDITERKQAEETLKESESRFRNIIENSKDGIIFFDGKTRKILIGNGAMAELLGCSKADLVGRSIPSLHPSEAWASVEQEFQKHVSGEISVSVGIPVLRSDGSVFYADISSSLIMLEGRSYFSAFFRDITERKQAEEALRESETRFRTLFEAIPDSILVHDDEGTILHINEIGAQQLEWSAKDLVGRNLREIVTPENRASIADHISETFKVGWCRFETTYVSRSGWKIVVEVNDRPIKLGKKKAILRVARDITERKEAEKALVREKNFSNAVINSSPGLMFVFGEKGNIIQWNSNAENVTGYSASEISKMNVLEFVAKEYTMTAAEAVQEALTKGQASVELDVLTKPGKKIPFFITGRRTKIENANCVVCSGIDITERKQATAALRESEEKHRDLVENINDILYTADETGIITYISPTIEPISGYAPSEIIGRTFTDFVYQEDLPQVLKKFQELVSGHLEPYEYRMVAKAGDVRWVRTSSRPFFQETRVIGVRGVLTDITERKQAEEEAIRGYEQLRETLHATVNALASIVEMKDQYTAGHQPRVTQLACAIAEEMGLPAEQIEGVRMAASIHDIGKIIVPAEILNKPGSLTAIQYEMIKMHPRAGYDILKGIKFPWPVAKIVLQHHELMDGSGYPQGLSGEEIIAEARILIVANVVEAMTTHRPYRPAFDIKEALAEIAQNRGILYDPTVVDACIRLFTEKAFTFFYRRNA